MEELKWLLSRGFKQLVDPYGEDEIFFAFRGYVSIRIFEEEDDNDKYYHLYVNDISPFNELNFIPEEKYYISNTNHIGELNTKSFDEIKLKLSTIFGDIRSEYS